MLDTEELIEEGEAVDVVVDCDGDEVEVVALDGAFPPLPEEEVEVDEMAKVGSL